MNYRWEITFSKLAPKKDNLKDLNKELCYTFTELGIGLLQIFDQAI